MNERLELGSDEDGANDRMWVTLHRLRFPAAWFSITCIPVPPVVPITVQLADRRVERRRKISDLARGKIRSGILSPDIYYQILQTYLIGRNVNRVISDGTPNRSAKPGHRPVPLLT